MICKHAENTKKSLEEQGCRTVEEIDAHLEEDRRLAELGDASAQYNVGLSYFRGVGVGVDKAEGLKWYRLAAAQGNSDAQNYLGAAYSTGEGVSVNKVESVKWYKLAAAQGEGDAKAQFNLGVGYVNVEG